MFTQSIFSPSAEMEMTASLPLYRSLPQTGDHTTCQHLSKDFEEGAPSSLHISMRSSCVATLLLAAFTMTQSAVVTCPYSLSPWSVRTYADIEVPVGCQFTFQWTSSAHNAVPMTLADFNSCTFSELDKVATLGPKTVTFNTPGIQYYGCGVNSHCNNGQKVKITVVAADTPTSAAAGTTKAGTIAPGTTKATTGPTNAGTAITPSIIMISTALAFIGSLLS